MKKQKSKAIKHSSRLNCFREKFKLEKFQGGHATPLAMPMIYRCNLHLLLVIERWIINAH